MHKPNYTDLIIYHANCADGMSAAACVEFYLDKRNTKYKSVPFYYDQPLTDLPDYKNINIWVVDFSFKKPNVESLLRDCKHLTIIDHHISATDDLESIHSDKFDYYFDNNESGASLTWTVLFPVFHVPTFIQFVKDRDLWYWKLPETSAFYSGMKPYASVQRYKDLIELNLSNHAMYRTTIQEILDAGHIVDTYKESILNKINVNETRHITFKGFEIPFTPCTHLVSETGNILSKDRPFSITYFDTRTHRVYSLRSNANNKNNVDVSVIAKSMGGGGHKYAAGFSLTFDDPNFL